MRRQEFLTILGAAALISPATGGAPQCLFKPADPAHHSTRVRHLLKEYRL
jgi:hypothetical protein